jgi:hypothetical protein
VTLHDHVCVAIRSSSAPRRRRRAAGSVRIVVVGSIGTFVEAIGSINHQIILPDGRRVMVDAGRTSARSSRSYALSLPAPPSPAAPPSGGGSGGISAANCATCDCVKM